MIDPKLNSICKLIDTWCGDHRIQYDIVCDETDIQGIMLFKKNNKVLADLMKVLYPSILEGNIFVQTRQVRGGVVIAFSLHALSESRIEQLAGMDQSEEIMSFTNKIDLAFAHVPDVCIEKIINNQASDAIPDIDFISAAQNIVREAQRKTATTAARRRFARSTINNLIPNSTNRTVKSKPSSGMRGPGTQSTKGAAKGVAKGPVHDDRQIFSSALNEALDGLATADGQQPGDLFKVFARALRVLGTKLGVGPLQDKLKQQGISWKQSDDGQSIILTIKNATTNVDQPIATINYETLQTPAEFEAQLKNMLDLATGQAPGAFTQQEKEVQDRKRTIGDIARAIKPQDREGEVAKLMNADMADAESAATLTAALPKESKDTNKNKLSTIQVESKYQTPQVQNTLRRLEAHHGYSAKWIRNMGEGIQLYDIGGMYYRIRGDGTII